MAYPKFLSKISNKFAGAPKPHPAPSPEQLAAAEKTVDQLHETLKFSKPGTTIVRDVQDGSVQYVATQTSLGTTVKDLNPVGYVRNLRKSKKELSHEARVLLSHKDPKVRKAAAQFLRVCKGPLLSTRELNQAVFELRSALKQAALQEERAHEPQDPSSGTVGSHESVSSNGHIEADGDTVKPLRPDSGVDHDEGPWSLRSGPTQRPTNPVLRQAPSPAAIAQAQAAPDKPDVAPSKAAEPRRPQRFVKPKFAVSRMWAKQTPAHDPKLACYMADALSQLEESCAGGMLHFGEVEIFSTLVDHNDHLSGDFYAFARHLEDIGDVNRYHPDPEVAAAGQAIHDIARDALDNEKTTPGIHNTQRLRDAFDVLADKYADRGNNPNFMSYYEGLQKAAVA